MSVGAPQIQVDYSENHDVQLITVGTVLIVIAFLSVVARLYSKKSKHLPLQSDDFLLVAAFVLALGETIMMIRAISFANLGRHSHPSHLSTYLIGLGKATFAASLVQPTILYLSKLSVLLLLSRIFITRAFRLTLLLLLLLTTAWFIATFLADLLICLPLGTHWRNPAICEGPQYRLDLATPIPWLVTDFAILLAPMPMVARLRLPRAQKVLVAALFLVGAATCVVSVIRYLTLFYNLDDITFQSADVAMWNMIEADVTVACAALVAAKPAFAWLGPGDWVEGSRRWYSERRSERERSGRRYDVEGGSGDVAVGACVGGNDVGAHGDFSRLPSEVSDGARVQLQDLYDERRKEDESIGIAI